MSGVPVTRGERRSPHQRGVRVVDVLREATVNYGLDAQGQLLGVPRLALSDSPSRVGYRLGYKDDTGPRPERQKPRSQWVGRQGIEP